MSNLLRFHTLVPSDLRAAIGWYGRISANLANQFRAAVDSRFDEIEIQPERFAVAFDDIRLARVKRFPYLILFRIRREFIQILGIFHAASDPQKWRKRSRGA